MMDDGGDTHRVATATLPSPRGSRHLIPLHVLLVYFLLYSTFAAITAGCMISSGFVIPMLVMGALIGRCVCPRAMPLAPPTFSSLQG